MAGLVIVDKDGMSIPESGSVEPSTWDTRYCIGMLGFTLFLIALSFGVTYSGNFSYWHLVSILASLASAYTGYLGLTEIQKKLPSIDLLSHDPLG